jgi:hypothetical protein
MPLGVKSDRSCQVRLACSTSLKLNAPIGLIASAGRHGDTNARSTNVLRRWAAGEGIHGQGHATSLTRICVPKQALQQWNNWDTHTVTHKVCYLVPSAHMIRCNIKFKQPRCTPNEWLSVVTVWSGRYVGFEKDLYKCGENEPAQKYTLVFLYLCLWWTTYLPRV